MWDMLEIGAKSIPLWRTSPNALEHLSLAAQASECTPRFAAPRRRGGKSRTADQIVVRSISKASEYTRSPSQYSPKLSAILEAGGEKHLAVQAAIHKF